MKCLRTIFNAYINTFLGGGGIVWTVPGTGTYIFIRILIFQSVRIFFSTKGITFSRKKSNNFQKCSVGLNSNEKSNFETSRSDRSCRHLGATMSHIFLSTVFLLVSHVSSYSSIRWIFLQFSNHPSSHFVSFMALETNVLLISSYNENGVRQQTVCPRALAQLTQHQWINCSCVFFPDSGWQYSTIIYYLYEITIKVNIMNIDCSRTVLFLRYKLFYKPVSWSLWLALLVLEASNSNGTWRQPDSSESGCHLNLFLFQQIYSHIFMNDKNWI